MSSILCIVRHGETDWNKQKKYQGQTDIGLNDHGLSQESSLLKELYKKDFNIILSSPLQRTMSTAIKLSRLKDIEYIKYDFLKERKLGQFESQNLQQIREKWPKEAETFEKILKEHKNQSIIIFTHGGVINCLYHYIHQSDMNQIGEWKIPIPNASYTTIKIGEKIEILEQSVTKHLSEESLDELK